MGQKTFWAPSIFGTKWHLSKCQLSILDYLLNCVIWFSSKFWGQNTVTVLFFRALEFLIIIIYILNLPQGLCWNVVDRLNLRQPYFGGSFFKRKTCWSLLNIYFSPGRYFGHGASNISSSRGGVACHSNIRFLVCYRYCYYSSSNSRTELYTNSLNLTIGTG